MLTLPSQLASPSSDLTTLTVNCSTLFEKALTFLKSKAAAPPSKVSVANSPLVPETTSPTKAILSPLSTALTESFYELFHFNYLQINSKDSFFLVYVIKIS